LVGWYDVDVDGVVICWSSVSGLREMSADISWLGSEKVGVDNALTLDGEFLNQKSDGMSLSFMPARRTSVVWLRTRGIGEDGRCSPRSA